MKACIIANGVLPPASVVRKTAASANIILCADGGANHAAAMKITPDLIIGDLDSISSAAKRKFKHVPMILQKDQISTDLEKAIRYCVAQWYDSVNIIGATGGRTDHTAGNLGCFKRFGTQITMRMIEQEGEITLVNGKTELFMRKGKTFSLMPLNRCTGVTVTNAVYPLRNDALELGVREGTSNRAKGGKVRISVKKGTLLLYKLH